MHIINNQKSAQPRWCYENMALIVYSTTHHCTKGYWSCRRELKFLAELKKKKEEPFAVRSAASGKGKGKGTGTGTGKGKGTFLLSEALRCVLEALIFQKKSVRFNLKIRKLVFGSQ